MFAHIRSSCLIALLAAFALCLTCVVSAPAVGPLDAIAARQATRANIVERANRVIKRQALTSAIPIIKCGSATAGVTYVMSDPAGYYTRNVDNFSSISSTTKRAATRVQFTNTCNVQEVATGDVFIASPTSDVTITFAPLNILNFDKQTICSVSATNKLSCSVPADNNNRMLRRQTGNLIWARTAGTPADITVSI